MKFILCEWGLPSSSKPPTMILSTVVSSISLWNSSILLCLSMVSLNSFPFPFISDCSRFLSWWRSSSPFAISISFVIEAYFFSQSSLETIPLTLGSTILSFCFSRFEILASRSVIFFAGEPERIVFLTMSLQSTPKTQKTRKRQISINAHEYGLFHLFFPSCIHTINLSPFRYEVGWVFIFEVDLFYHTSKALFFYRFTATKPFLQ